MTVMRGASAVGAAIRPPSKGGASEDSRGERTMPLIAGDAARQVVSQLLLLTSAPAAAQQSVVISEEGQQTSRPGIRIETEAVVMPHHAHTSHHTHAHAALAVPDARGAPRRRARRGRWAAASCGRSGEWRRRCELWEGRVRRCGLVGLRGHAMAVLVNLNRSRAAHGVSPR